MVNQIISVFKNGFPGRENSSDNIFDFLGLRIGPDTLSISQDGVGSEARFFLEARLRILDAVNPDEAVTAGQIESYVTNLLSALDGRDGVERTDNDFHLSTGGVTEDKLAEKAVTTGKIADKAVNTANIADQAVGLAQLAAAIQEILARSHRVDYLTLTQTDVDSKEVTLSHTPLDGTQVQVDIIKGLAQKHETDFIVTSKVVSWNNLGMQAILEEGDTVRFAYTSID